MTSIDSLLHESRRFAPSAEFAANAIAKPELYEAAAADRLGFWADQARRLHWHEPFTQVLDWSNPPFAKWFADGKLNVAYNCLDRHVLAGNGDRVAIHWQGEPGDTLSYTHEVDDKGVTTWFGPKGSPSTFKARWIDDNTLAGAWEWPGGGYKLTLTRIKEGAKARP